MRYAPDHSLIALKKTKDPINFQEKIKRAFYKKLPRKLVRKALRRWPIIYDYDIMPYPDAFFTRTLRMTGHPAILTELIQTLMQQDMQNGLPKDLMAIFKLGAAIRGEGPFPIFPDDGVHACSGCGDCTDEDPEIGETNGGNTPPYVH